MSRATATATGFIAVLLWALLALFTVGSSPTPPLLLNTLCFGIGGIVGLIWAWVTGSVPQMRTVPLRVYAFGALGLFAYHLLYFSALRLAPAAEAGLIAYLWPLLIVVFSGLLPCRNTQSRSCHWRGLGIFWSGAHYFWWRHRSQHRVFAGLSPCIVGRFYLGWVLSPVAPSWLSSHRKRCSLLRRHIHTVASHCT